MGRFQDLSGVHFGRLIAIKREPNQGKKTMWLCRCECGHELVVAAGDLKAGKTRSCGCLYRENVTNQVEDLTGRRFGRLVVIEQAIPYVSLSGEKKVQWLCRCDCGNSAVVRAGYLQRGTTQSCGCFQREQTAHACTTHGGSHSRLFHVWATMIQRTTNPNDQNYKNYGGRGIRMCDEWRSSFAAFRDWAMQNGYDENAPRGECTIDRIDVNGNYEPDNCRWVDMYVQSQNKRNKAANSI